MLSLLYQFHVISPMMPAKLITLWISYLLAAVSAIGLLVLASNSILVTVFKILIVILFLNIQIAIDKNICNSSLPWMMNASFKRHFEILKQTDTGKLAFKTMLTKQKIVWRKKGNPGFLKPWAVRGLLKALIGVDVCLPEGCSTGMWIHLTNTLSAYCLPC